MSRLIEFVGLPGAGKTTIARAFLAESRRNGNEWMANDKAMIRCLRRRDDGMVCNLLKRFPYLVWEPFAGSRHALAELHAFSSKYPSLLALIFELMHLETVPSHLRQCVLYALYLHCSERQILETWLKTEEGVIVEEGLAMGLLALLDCLPHDAPYQELISDYIRSMPTPFGLVWVDIDPSECAVRLGRRPSLPLPWEGFSGIELLENLTIRRHALALIFAECECRGIPCCRIMNSERDAATAPQRLVEQINTWSHFTESR